MSTAARKQVDQFVRELLADGTWEELSKGRSPHRRLRHLPTGRKLFLPVTPSDWRAFKNMAASARRIERGTA